MAKDKVQQIDGRVTPAGLTGSMIEKVDEIETMLVIAKMKDGSTKVGICAYDKPETLSHMWLTAQAVIFDHCYGFDAL